MSKINRDGIDLDFSSGESLTSFEVPHTGSTSIGEELDVVSQATVSELEELGVNSALTDQRMYSVTGGTQFILPVASVEFDGFLTPFGVRNRSGVDITVLAQGGDVIEGLYGDVTEFILEPNEVAILYISSTSSFGVYSSFNKPFQEPQGNEDYYLANFNGSSDAPDSVFNFNTGVLEAGTYEIMVTSNWQYSAINRMIMADLRINGLQEGFLDMEPKKAGDKRPLVLRRVLALSGAVPIEFNVWSTQNGDIYNLDDITLTVTRRVP